MNPQASQVTPDFKGLGGRSAQILQDIRREILSGVFPAGGKLPTEQELCFRFKVSRPTVRKAMGKLVDEGLITVRAGAGMFVNPGPRGEPCVMRAIAVMYPFAAGLPAEMQQAILARGYLPVLLTQPPAAMSSKLERLFLEAVLQDRCHALVGVCSPEAPANEDLLRLIAARGTRVVHVEPHGMDLPAHSYLMPDYRLAGSHAAVALLLAGYDEVVLVAVDTEPRDKLIAQGFLEMVASHRGGEATGCVIHGDLVRNEKTRRLFQERITKPGGSIGVACTSAAAAAAARLQLEAAGWEIPGRAGLVQVQLTDGPEAPGEELVDAIVVDRLKCLADAVEAVLEPAWKGLRTLVRPRILARGTIRRPHPEKLAREAG